MKATFLVEINLDDITTLATVSEQIQDDLSDNFDVVSVKPWARPSMQVPVSSPTLSPTDETTTTQPEVV